MVGVLDVSKNLSFTRTCGIQEHVLCWDEIVKANAGGQVSRIVERFVQFFVITKLVSAQAVFLTNVETERIALGIGTVGNHGTPGRVLDDGVTLQMKFGSGLQFLLVRIVRYLDFGVIADERNVLEAFFYVIIRHIGAVLIQFGLLRGLIHFGVNLFQEHPLPVGLLHLVRQQRGQHLGGIGTRNELVLIHIAQEMDGTFAVRQFQLYLEGVQGYCFGQWGIGIGNGIIGNVSPGNGRGFAY